ncbi:MAG: NAD(P)H-dependent oxidoreductase subunit E [Clostridiales bacterium]|nr:NAD(P)H-dependent oxidoreductase subunit E [Clostridiales bacterium]
MDFQALEPALLAAGQDSGALIGVLQQAQEIYGYLPIEILEYIAERMEIAPAKVLGVTTFYAQFRTRPVGKNLVMLCQGTACHVTGSSAVAEAVGEFLGVAEDDMTEDGLFTYTNVACLGCCSLAPAMMVGDRVFGELTADKVVEILEEIKNEE